MQRWAFLHNSPCHQQNQTMALWNILSMSEWSCQHFCISSWDSYQYTLISRDREHKSTVHIIWLSPSIHTGLGFPYPSWSLSQGPVVTLPVQLSLQVLCEQESLWLEFMDLLPKVVQILLEQSSDWGFHGCATPVLMLFTGGASALGASWGRKFPPFEFNLEIKLKEL